MNNEYFLCFVRRAPLLTLNWLLESIVQKQPVVEVDAYTFKLTTNKPVEVDAQDAPSPASKKNIQSMNHPSGTFKVPRKKLAFKETENDPNTSNRLDQQDGMNDMLEQYLSVESHTSVKVLSPRRSKRTQNEAANKSKSPDVGTTISEAPTFALSSTVAPSIARPTTAHSANETGSSCFDSQMTSSDLTQILDFLKGMTVCIVGFDEESSQSLTQYSKMSGADIVENTDRKVDYLIAATDKMTMNDVRVKATNIVNSNWLVSNLNHFKNLMKH